MRVVVTGGAGYIGSHAVRALVDAGHAVAVLDDLSAGHEQAVPPGVPLVRARIHDRAAVTKLLADHRADAVMHFAAWLAVAESVQKPLEYYQNNVGGTLAVLEAMRDAGVGRFIFSSTCAVYGEPSGVPIVETLEKRPINAYGETKLAVERALPHFERAYGIKWIALRYFNAAGAHPDGTIGEDHADEIHLIPLAIRAANGGTPLRVFGEDYPTPDGTCLRDYIHVSDLADAHVIALDHLVAGGTSLTLNCGYGHGHSVMEVLARVQRQANMPIDIRDASRRPGDPPVLIADPGKLRRVLTWQPRYDDLDLIIRTALDWERKNRVDAGPKAKTAAPARVSVLRS